MQHNSTTLFLESPGATTPVPWVDNAPDLSGFTDPTLSVLQQSWADFLASEEELEVIPDPAQPQPLPEPDFLSFNLAMDGDSDFDTWFNLLPPRRQQALSATAATGGDSELQVALDAAKAAVPFDTVWNNSQVLEIKARWQDYASQHGIGIQF